VPAALQIIDLDAFGVAIGCSALAVMATPDQLAEAAAASAGPPRAPNSDGSGLSSRPNAPFKLWLDFLGSYTDPSSRKRQKHLVLCKTVAEPAPASHFSSSWTFGYCKSIETDSGMPLLLPRLAECTAVDKAEWCDVALAATHSQQCTARATCQTRCCQDDVAPEPHPFVARFLQNGTLFVITTQCPSVSTTPDLRKT
jgi:hypothetical protein